MGGQVGDDGKSEGRLVIRRIGDAHAPRESGLTSSGSFVTRELDEPIEKAKQMTAELSKTAGAAFHGAVDWHAIERHTAHPNVNRLQARIVKATQLDVAKPRPARGV